MIRVVDPSDDGAALRRRRAVHEYDWVVLTSANGAERLCRELRDARAFGAARVAAIGPGTAAALRRWGVAADLLPARFVAESMVEAFPSGTGRVLLPRAAVARDVLPDGLRAKGWTVDVVEAYRTERPPVSDAMRASARSADAVTFTSSSTVTNYLEAVGDDAVPGVVACIGPVTAETARRGGCASTSKRSSTPSTASSTRSWLTLGNSCQARSMKGVSFPARRLRRLRRTPALRRLVAEATVTVDDLVAPLFVREGIDAPQPIASMPGVVQHTRESLRKEVRELADLGLPAVILFGVPEHKDARRAGRTTPTASCRWRCVTCATRWASRSSSSPTSASTSTPTTGTAECARR